MITRDWNDVAASQGMPAATRSWKRQGVGFPHTSDTGFGLRASRTVRDSICVVLSHHICDNVL